MKEYKQFTVESLIERLRHDPDMIVEGLSADAYSFRGYYDQVAIEPGDGVQASALAEYLQGKIGTTMYGYKGGEYEFRADCNVFVSRYGHSGPMLVGIEDDGSIVLCEEGWNY